MSRDFEWAYLIQFSRFSNEILTVNRHRRPKQNDAKFGCHGYQDYFLGPNAQNFPFRANVPDQNIKKPITCCIPFKEKITSFLELFLDRKSDYGFKSYNQTINKECRLGRKCFKNSIFRHSLIFPLFSEHNLIRIVMSYIFLKLILFSIQWHKNCSKFGEKIRSWVNKNTKNRLILSFWIIIYLSRIKYF